MNVPAIFGMALCLAGGAAMAKADVLEIAADGTIAIRASDAGSTQPLAANDMEDAPALPEAAVTMIDRPAVPPAFQSSLTRAADAAGVSPALLAALVWQESRWRPTLVSPKGARGLTQLMPRTARALAVDPADVAANLAGGARYLRFMLDRFDGDVERALAAYNAGPARVSRAGGLPAIAETRAYVSAIIDRLGAGGAPLGGVKP